MPTTLALASSNWSLPSLAESITDKTQWKSTISLEHLTSNNYRNHLVADKIQDDYPEVSRKLRLCCRYVQRQKEGHWQAAYHCRQHRVCGNCHALRSRLLRKQFIVSSYDFAREYDLETRLASFVLHVQLPRSTPHDQVIPWTAAAIKRFGDQMRPMRNMFNHCNGRLRRKQWRRASWLIGPMMLSSHVRPVGKSQYGFPGLQTKEDMHLHVLACLPANYKISNLKSLMASVWQHAQRETESRIGPIDATIKQERRIFDTDGDALWLIGYTARHIRPQWNFIQAERVSNLVRELPPSAVYRLLGKTQPLGDLPHRTPIRGDAMKYMHRERRFVPHFLGKWE